MAAHLTIHSIRQSRHNWFAWDDRIALLGSSFIAGLGVFGLAASGMCPPIGAQSAPPDLSEAPRSANQGEEEPEARFFFVAHKETPVGRDWASQCQL